MILKLYFQRPTHDGVVREFVCSFTDKEKAITYALQDLHNRCPEFKSYYQRTWEEDGELWIDFGSWSEFYVVTIDDEPWVVS